MKIVIYEIVLLILTATVINSLKTSSCSFSLMGSSQKHDITDAYGAFKLYSQVRNIDDDGRQEKTIPSSSSYFYSKKQFRDIGLTTTMDSVLSFLRIEQPSKIQALSYQTILSGKHSIVADQTGSGKTLSYLMPTLQRMVELTRNGTIGSVQSRAPYILVVTPTTELANQVSRVVKSIANVLKFRTASVTSVSDMDSEQKKLRLGADVLVATPGRLLALMNRKEVSLDKLQCVIFDEADILFMDQSFPLQPIGAACSMDAQFIFTTATLPDIVLKQIIAEFPDVEYLSGPGLHRIAPTVEEVLIDCSGPPSQLKNPETAFENKMLALLKSLEQSDASRTLIFCNTITQCRNVENALNRADRNRKLRTIFPYHGAIDSQAREDNIVSFSRPLLKTKVVLVCTDRASRGMDFDRAEVDHVILFDFPQEPSEYVRRVGRTGRAGRNGLVTVLVHGRQVPIAKSVLGASIEGKRIDPVPALNNFESFSKD